MNLPEISPHEASPLLSIVVPVYNYADKVTVAIESVVKQITPKCELIVINDGSTDDSNGVILKASKDYQFKYYSKPNEGLAETRNFGIEHSLGEYIVFLDADDYLTDGAIQAFLTHIESSTAPLLVFGHESIRPDGSVKVHRPPAPCESPEAAFLAYGEGKVSFSSGSVAFTRKVFDEIKFPSHLQHAEDQPVYALLIANFAIESFDFPTCAVVKHLASMRKNADAAMEANLEVVDYLFCHPKLPQGLGRHRKTFTASRHLSIFRTLYKANRYREALDAYRRAIMVSPMRIFQMKYLVKAIKALIFKVTEAQEGK